jgi:Recombinase
VALVLASSVNTARAASLGGYAPRAAAAPAADGLDYLVAGATLYSEAARLNALGIPAPGYKYGRNPRTPSQKWTASTLSRLVHRSVYAGTRRVKINAGEGLIEDAAPAIISPDCNGR